MINAEILKLCDSLRQTLSPEFRVVPECDGFVVLSHGEICGSDRIANMWRDGPDLWHWRSLYLERVLSGTGGERDGKAEVRKAVKNAAEAKQNNIDFTWPV
jgi:hypothetical protein